MRRISSGTRPGRGRPIPGCNSRRSAAAVCLPPPICAPPTSPKGTSCFRRRHWWRSKTPTTEAVAICAAARALGMASYLDGARLFNAAVALGKSLAELAAPFDLVSVALSKGLGCPVGSVLAGSRELIAHAHRARRMFGGAMRQAGILAAAGLYALDHNVARLAEDHANARQIGERLAAVPGVELDLGTVQTNIVIFHLAAQMPDAAAIVAAAAEKGVLVSAFAARTVRAVTHLDVSDEQCRRAGGLLAAVIAAARKPGR